VGGTLFFTAADGKNGFELWKSDGTAQGTLLVKDIYPGRASSVPSFLTNVDGTLFFAAADGLHGVELWKSDGTPGGTTLVKDIRLGAGHSVPRHFTKAGARVVFAGNGENGTRLWQSDGSAAGTVPLGHSHTPLMLSNPRELVLSQGKLFAIAEDAAGSTFLHSVEVKPPLPERAGVVPWKTFAQVQVRRADGRFVPEFPQAVAALDQKTITVEGFMFPLDDNDEHAVFILSAVAPECDIHMPGGPEAVIEVHAERPLAYSDDPITLVGKLSVLKAEASGIFYRLTAAVPAK